MSPLLTPCPTDSSNGIHQDDPSPSRLQTEVSVPPSGHNVWGKVKDGRGRRRCHSSVGTRLSCVLHDKTTIPPTPSSPGTLSHLKL